MVGEKSGKLHQPPKSSIIVEQKMTHHQIFLMMLLLLISLFQVSNSQADSSSDGKERETESEKRDASPFSPALMISAAGG